MKKNKLKKYKFRAECLSDVIHFLRQFGVKKVKIKSMKNIPDVTAVIKTKKSIKELIKIAQNLEDCHVIAQTIRKKKEYTGERDYFV